MKIEARGALNERALDAFVPFGSYPGLEIDLHSVRFIETCGLVALACLVEYHAAEGDEISLRPPMSGNATEYLSRMNVCRVLEERCGIRDALPTVHSADLRGRLLEVQRYETEDGADELTDILEQRLSYSLLRSEAQPVVDAVWEMATNAVEHSGTGVGYFAAQVYEPGRRTARVDFGVGDWGQGIRESLAETRHARETDVLAIEEAVKMGVSRYATDPTRGKGLPFTVFDKAVARGGQITIRSRAGAVSFFPQGRFRRRIPPRPGVLVSGSIPCW
jgi:hypothetical protein